MPGAGNKAEHEKSKVKQMRALAREGQSNLVDWVMRILISLAVLALLGGAALGLFTEAFEAISLMGEVTRRADILLSGGALMLVLAILPLWVIWRRSR